MGKNLLKIMRKIEHLYDYCYQDKYHFAFFYSNNGEEAEYITQVTF